MRDRGEGAPPQAIEDYALIGDLHTAALVGRNGSIDWLCLPHYDDPACFAALLHDESAGSWAMAPAYGGMATSRSYEDDSLVLRTRWESDSGIVEVVDFMPPRGEAADVVRVVEGISGSVEMRSTLRLRFDYGQVVPWFPAGEPDGAQGVSAVAGPDAVWVRAETPLRLDDHALRADFTVVEGDRIAFVLTYRRSHLPRPRMADPHRALEDTRAFWREWIGRCTYRGRWQAEVRRSLILLKALTFAPTGGMVAAATTSLPEDPGGVRNWDYRYCWLRDATFTLQAFLGTGHTGEAQAWREWLVRAVAGDPATLQIMYGLDGTRRLPEQALPWLDGYLGSAPVRIGNAAARQHQLDVWGEALDGLYLAREAGLHFTEAAWDLQRSLVDWLRHHWHEPDNGLWEMRGPRRQFVHSKVMAWAGVDRAIRTVERHGLEGDVDAWAELADRIHADVCAKGFDPERNTFTQFYGSHGLDAALLLIPRVGFLPWDDQRVVGTIEAVARELDRDGFLIRYDNRADRLPGRHRGGDRDGPPGSRYDNDADRLPSPHHGSDHDGPPSSRYDNRADGGTDGLPGDDAAFLACSFWLVDALHGIGESRRAEELFERLLAVRNDVGMLSEEYDARTGRHLGNTPQAFSLVGLINSARHLTSARASDSRDTCA